MEQLTVVFDLGYSQILAIGSGGSTRLEPFLNSSDGLDLSLDLRRVLGDLDNQWHLLLTLDLFGISDGADYAELALVDELAYLVPVFEQFAFEFSVDDLNTISQIVKVVLRKR